ncbi:MAG: MobA/MobL family protein [Burkholderiales bacterium]|nr:MobA/MobL family protein [Burkholderiales bacterium]
MAIYHLSVKAVSRSVGRSATAAAAYRAGCEMADERTGVIHDYRRKGGVESAEIVLPDGAPEWATDRAKLWNAAELAEKRKDACVAREYEVALPAELSPSERRRLALDFARDMANREGCSVDVAIHAPGRGGDNRNHHAHLLRTTRKVEAEGMGAKLDAEKAGRNRTADLEAVRVRWAEMANIALERAGHAARVDHRSLEAQREEERLGDYLRRKIEHAERLEALSREPTRHLGPTATAFERRTWEPSRLRLDFEREAMERLERAREAGDLERQGKALDRAILDLSGDLNAARAERDRQQRDAEQKRQRIEMERVKPIEKDRRQAQAEREREFESRPISLPADRFTIEVAASLGLERATEPGRVSMPQGRYFDAMQGGSALPFNAKGILVGVDLRRWDGGLSSADQLALIGMEGLLSNGHLTRLATDIVVVRDAQFLEARERGGLSVQTSGERVRERESAIEADRQRATAATTISVTREEWKPEVSKEQKPEINDGKDFGL